MDKSGKNAVVFKLLRYAYELWLLSYHHNFKLFYFSKEFRKYKYFCFCWLQLVTYKDWEVQKYYGIFFYQVSIPKRNKHFACVQKTSGKKVWNLYIWL